VRVTSGALPVATDLMTTCDVESANDLEIRGQLVQEQEFGICRPPSTLVQLFTNAASPEAICTKFARKSSVTAHFGLNCRYYMS
jgi:hypothetical protein